MTLYELLLDIPRFVSRHMFALYVEDELGNLREVEKIDFRASCLGAVLTIEPPPVIEDAANNNWDDELLELRSEIDDAWSMVSDSATPAAKIFNPTCDVISIETAYRLLNETYALLDRMYER